jgi:hypothetical protein
MNAVIDDNTYYFITDNYDKKYSVSIKVNKNKLPFIKNGDIVNVGYNKETDVTEIKTLK